MAGSLLPTALTDGLYGDAAVTSMATATGKQIRMKRWALSDDVL